MSGGYPQRYLLRQRYDGRMREIKFRAWDKKEKKMRWWVDSIVWTANGEVESIEQCSAIHCEANKAEDVDLMQYTGLKDKNGKEIYEGDVLKFEEGDTAQVVWMDDGFKLVGDEFEGDALFPQIRSTDGEPAIWSEVIGNIYENSELLN